MHKKRKRLRDDLSEMKSISCTATLHTLFLTTTTMANIQTVLSALDVFSRAPDKASLETANAWLQDFQHSVINFAYGPSRPSPSDFSSLHP